MFDFVRSRSAPSLSTTSATRTIDWYSLRSELIRSAATRQIQLVNLRPSDPSDRVAAEYRASVRRIYDDILSALDRMDAGTYGLCTDCSGRMPAQRLVDRPWTANCEPCTARSQ